MAAGIAAEALDRNLISAQEIVKLFPDPPVPGSFSKADDLLDGSDLTALRSLRDDPDAGISPAGLPRRVLAGLRVYEMTKNPADREAILKIAVREAPSVLTPRALVTVDWAGAEGPEFWSQIQQTWEKSEEIRHLFRRYPNAGSSGRWVSGHDGTWWISAEKDGIRAISPERLELALLASRSLMPAWADMQFTPAGVEEKGEALASAPLIFPGGGMVEIVVARPAVLERVARQQARWTLGLLACATAVSGGALWQIHRAVARERRLNALKSDFVASVSHELRAPVASIRLMADALGAGKIEPRTVAEFHALISREGARLSALIENVLDFARIEQGRKRWDREPAELAPLVRESLELMAPLAAEKSVTLAAAGLLPELVANVDAGAIRQALVNLLDNAIKFSPPGASVEISLTATAADWRIAISDDGPGIPEAEHARIFERFHRLGSELRRETQGTGIGLSLVKAVAEAHGGRVGLESAPGAGSTFTLLIPRTEEIEPRISRMTRTGRDL